MKKSYKGFPAYLFIVLGVMMVSHLFTSMMNPNRGSRIGYSELLTYIEQGVISHVAVERDTVYARMSESKIPAEAFSSEMYDFVADADGDTFVEACRQLAA